MNKNIGRLIVQLGLDPKDLERGLKQARSHMSRFNNTIGDPMQKMGQGLKNMGWAIRRIGIDLTTYIITPLVAIGTMATNLYKGFEFSMQKINSLVGVAQGQIEAWNDQVLQMSTVTGRGPKELADALYFITSAGVRGAEALNVLEASAKAAASGLGDTKDVANLVTSAVNAYGSSMMSAMEATDILIAAVKEGKADAVDFANTMGKILPVASEMEVEFYQVAGAMAAMTRTGSNAFEASTQLRQVLFSIAKPAEQSKVALAQMGTSIEEVRDIIANQGLLEGLMFLKDLTNQYGEDLMAQVFPNIRAFVGVIDLLGSNLEENRAIMERMGNTVGLTENAFGVASETLQVQFDNALNSVKTELIKVGEAIKTPLMGLLNDFSEAVSKLGQNFAGLSEAQQESKIRFIAYSAAIGGGLTAFSILIITLGNVVLMLNKLSGILLTNPWALAAAAVGSLIWLLVKLIKKIREQNSALSESTKISKEVGDRYAEQTAKIKSLVWVIENENMSNNKRIQAINELKSIMPEYNGQLTKEGELINHNKQSIDDYVSSLYKLIEVDVVREQMTDKMVKRAKLEQQLNDALYENGLAYEAYKEKVKEWEQQLKNADASQRKILKSLIDIEKKKILRKNPDLEFIINAKFDIATLDYDIKKLKERLSGIVPTAIAETDLIGPSEKEWKRVMSMIDGYTPEVVQGFIATLKKEIEDLQTQMENAPKGKIYEIQVKLAQKQEVLNEWVNMYDSMLKRKEWFEGQVKSASNETRRLEIENAYQGAQQKHKLLDLEMQMFEENLAAQLQGIKLNAKEEQKLYELRLAMYSYFAEKRKQIEEDSTPDISNATKEIINIQRDAEELRIQNMKDSWEEELAIAKKRREWFLEDIKLRQMEEGFDDSTLKEYVQAYETWYAEEVKRINLGISNSFQNMSSVITGAFRGMGKYGSDSFKEITRWISDVIGAIDKFVTATKAAIAAQKALNQAKQSGVGEGEASDNAWGSFMSVISTAGSIISIFAGIPMASGGIVPPGYPNDTYPALLTSGEVVIPNGGALPMGGMQGQVVFEIEGDRLVGILQKMNRKNRIS